MWSLFGWLSTKPYDKSQVYQIADKLGVYPKQMPCLVLFDKLETPDRLVFPIDSASPFYFRDLFTALKRCLQIEGVSETPYEMVKKQYTSILEDLRQEHPAASQLDMAAIRALLSAAFRGKDLWQFCQGQPAFRPVLDRVNSDPPLEDIVDVLMEYCLKQALFGELLAEIKDINPRQYERFEPQLCGNNA